MALHPKKPRDLVVVQVGLGSADAFNFGQIRHRIIVQPAFFDGQGPRDKCWKRQSALPYQMDSNRASSFFRVHFAILRVRKLNGISMLCGAVLC